MRRVPPALVYLIVVLLITWPLAWNLGSAVVGFGGVDAEDTITLRGAVASALSHPRWEDGHLLSDAVYFPAGYPIFQLMPNVLDHLLALPLVWGVPFPWSDNLWWIAALTATGWSAHRLGRVIGGTEAAGYLCGAAVLLSEPVAREANLHHAPQSRVLWGPLYLEALWRLRQDGAVRTAAGAGVALAGAALSYWYQGMFFGLGSLVLLVIGGPGEHRPSLRALAALVGTTAALTLPFLAPLLLGWSSGPVTSGGHIPPPVGLPDAYSAVPEAWRFIAQHGQDLNFFLQSTPMDTSSQITLGLGVAAVLGARALPRGTRLGFAGMALLGAVMVLGPYAMWQGAPILVDGRPIALPFRWMAELHPIVARLTWPERWGVLLPLGLGALAARAPRPALFAAWIAAESLLRSANLPLQVTSLRWSACQAALAHAPGAILELPLARDALRASRVGVHRRFHGRPLVNPLLLPPGARPPAAWDTWTEGQPLMAFLKDFERGRWPADPGADAVRSLAAAGVSALVVDAEPNGALSATQLKRFQVGLGRTLGPPVDRGCALVGWIDPRAAPPAGLARGDDWRAAQVRAAAEAPPPALPTLMSSEGPDLGRERPAQDARDPKVPR